MYESVVGQSYQVNVHDEYVLLGNAALLRCLVPSFVSDYVIVDAWQSDADDVITPNQLHGISSLPLPLSLFPPLLPSLPLVLSGLFRYIRF